MVSAKKKFGWKELYYTQISQNGSKTFNNMINNRPTPSSTTLKFLPSCGMDYSSFGNCEMKTITQPTSTTKQIWIQLSPVFSIPDNNFCNKLKTRYSN